MSSPPARPNLNAIIRSGSPSRIVAAIPNIRCKFPGAAGAISSGVFYQRTGEDRLLAIAAGVVFYGLLAMFPTITALVSLYGLFADPQDHRRQSAIAGADAAARLVPDRAGPDRPRAQQRQCRARHDVSVRSCAGAVERQCRRQSDHRRAQRRLWRDRKARLLQAQRVVAAVHDQRDRGAADDGRRGGGAADRAGQHLDHRRRQDAGQAWRAGRCCSCCC